MQNNTSLQIALDFILNNTDDNSNNTTNGDPTNAKKRSLIVTEVTIYCIIFILSTIGNIVVILVVSKKRRMQTVTNWLIVNLAVADLAVTLICIPVEIPLIMNGGIWLYGKIFCRMLYPLQTMTIYASVYTLVAMSLTRYWAIRHPFRRQMTTKQAKILICFLWLASFAFVIPLIISLSYDESQRACIENITPQQSRSYTIAIFVSQYVFPLLIISFAYILIAMDLRSSPKTDTSLIQQQKRKENTKVLSMIMIVTITFAICVLPYHVVGLYREFSGQYAFPHHAEVSAASFLLLFANSCLNPIIYNAFNSKFRSSFTELWNQFIYCGKRKNYGASPTRLQQLVSSDANPTDMNENEGNRRSNTYCASTKL